MLEKKNTRIADLKKSTAFWKENPALVDRYLKALCQEAKKPVAQQRSAFDVAKTVIEK